MEIGNDSKTLSIKEVKIFLLLLFKARIRLLEGMLLNKRYNITINFVRYWAIND